MKYLPFIFIILFLCNSCTSKVQTVQKENYDWKYFGKNPKYQTVDLDQYISPNKRDGQDSELILIVCASGGGTRAATFTMGIMLEIERILYPKDKKRNILNEVDYFSTTSGGGWGASSYIAYLYKHEPHFTTYNSFETYLANWADRKIDSYQFSYAISDYFNDHFQTKKEELSSGNILQNRINTGYLGGGYRNQQLGDETPIMLSDVFTLKGTGKKPRLPMIIANTMNIDNFMLVPFTPDRLHYWGLSQYSKNTGELIPSKHRPSNTLSLPEILNIPLAAGIKASGGVPGLVGTSYFYCNKKGEKKGYYLRLQDGGVIDNQGLYTAKVILQHEKTIKPNRKKVVIMIDASTPGSIKTSRPQYKNGRRSYSFWQILRKGITEGPYPLMREELSEIDSMYDCKVIHLSTEALLDTSLGLRGEIPKRFTYKIDDAENVFHKTYKLVLKNPEHYSTYISMKERAMLYDYTEKIVPSRMIAKGSNSKGVYKEDKPEDVKGSTKIMFLAGRAVVQLMRDTIIGAF